MKALKNILKNVGLLEPLREWRTTRDIRNWSTHDDKMKSFYSQFLKDDELCFDIGANRGNRTKIFLSLNSKVIGFEPQPHCAEFLRREFGNNKKFELEPIALGSQEGEGELNISEVDTLSSLSNEWMKKQKESGRFDGIGWKEKIKVPIKTLDQMIEKHGLPTFAKIDVEGFELEVIRGLTSKVNYLSFEFAPEFMDPLIACVDLLSERFDSKFNFSTFETMELEFNDWLSAKELKEFLLKHSNDFEFFGDIYVKSL